MYTYVLIMCVCVCVHVCMWGGGGGGVVAFDIVNDQSFSRIRIEPLLARMATDRRIMVQPWLDSINGETFQYSWSGTVPFRNGFSWDMQYNYERPGKFSWSKRDSIIAPVK